MAEHEEEKPDGLEIVSIGKLYNGPWDKKYWSSSRGKDRHPYPVGYRAVRSQNQITYTMEILEGVKGPLFMISSTDGQSCSGQTPDIVWERFQKKGCVQIKLWHGKRFSCKIDGVELFGFKNPFVQRLLRELVSNVSLTEQSLLSSSFNNGFGTCHHDKTQCTKCCKAPCTCPDFQPDMGKPLVTRKRSAKNNVTNLKLNKEGKLKRTRHGDETQNVDVSTSGQSCPNHFNNGSSTSSISKEQKADLETVIDDGNSPVLAECNLQFDSANSFKPVEQAKDLAAAECNHFNSRSSTAKEEATTFSEDKEIPDWSKFTSTQGFSLPKQVEESVKTYVPKDSPTINDQDLFAPDTLELQQDENYNTVMDIPIEGHSNIKDELNVSQIVIAEDSINESHAEEVVISTVNDNSEKCDTDSVGHEIASSMMTVLLPRALPLLKTFSRKKKTTAKSAKVSRKGMRSLGEEEGRKLSTDLPSPAELHTEDLNKERQMNKANTPRKDFGSVSPSCEDLASVVPDSFDDNQCDNTESTKLLLFQGFSESDRSAFGQYSCIPESTGLHGDGNCQQCHAADSVTNFCPEINMVLEKGSGRKENLISVKHNGKIGDILELVGCYAHPMPISTVLMRTDGNEMYICVLCGYHMGKEKSVFVYKVPVKGEGRGCPSIIGHASLVSPYFYASGGEIALDGSSLQLTPDGQRLVLPNSIKAPYCSVGNVYCPCSVCTSACLERNAVKIVEVKLGYVSAALKLKTTDSVCCILVCGPCYLLAAEDSGRLHLWTMNSSWTDTTKESYLPTSDCMRGCIVDMKRIPKSEGLVVGQNAFGEFCLWDIAQQILVSKFSAPHISVFRFLPVSLFRLSSTAFSTAGIDSEEYINNIMDETNVWSSKGGVKGEDVAVCLLISSATDPDALHDYQSDTSGINPVGSWSLALLARNTLILGNTLDPRAAVAGASGGYGIMSTCDKLLYMWELSKGSELGALQYCKGAEVSYIGAEDSDSGAFAIGYDGGQLQVYLHSAMANSEER